MTTGKKVAVGTGVLVALLLVIEVLLRVTLGLGSPPLIEAHDRIGYVVQANQDLQRFGNRVTINSYHQRSAEFSENDQAVRVLFVGDSVTWGGVLTDQEETYPAFFREAISTTCQQPVAALNASAGSWGIGNQRAYLAEFGVFDSELVVLQIGSHDLLQATSTAEVVGVHPSYPDARPLTALGELVARYAWPRAVRTLGLASGPSADDGADDDRTPAHIRFEANMDDFRAMIKEVRDRGLRL